MSSTLVETVTFLPHHLHHNENNQGEGLAVHLQTSSIAEEPWVAQLSHLASQHHTSEYNRIKYGHQGCPIAYVPLSVHLPNVVRELRARQIKNSEQELWWPCPGVKSGSLGLELQKSFPSADTHKTNVELQRELSDAISESLPTTPRVTRLTPSPSLPSQAKTSETHPINVSIIIPPESIVTLSSHLTHSVKPSPVMFDIPPAYSLDRVAGYAQLFRTPPSVPTIPVYTRSPHTIKQARQSVSEALQAAINTTLVSATMPPAISKVLSLKSAMTSISRTRTTMTSNVSAIHKQSTSISVSVNARQSTKHIHSLSGGQDTAQPIYPGTIVIPKLLTQQTASMTDTPYHNSRLISPFSTKLRNTTTSFTTSVHLTTPKTFRLGNLFLSSCPGKKVRLNGPVRGRSAVCRDLEMDLRRMKDLGVRCVICCLDDAELQLLGTTWSDYYQTAHRLGLDVLRIPLPEGLAPLTAESLDIHLTQLIETYTLHSLPVLVHCRGGVGRAGLVACCWMLKLGLCGWIETDLPPSSFDMKKAPTTLTAPANPIRRDTVQLVERAISVVRQRRSVKAVETLEQVKFLIDFVEYLRELGSTPTGSALPSLDSSMSDIVYEGLVK